MNVNNSARLLGEFLAVYLIAFICFFISFYFYFSVLGEYSHVDRLMSIFNSRASFDLIVVPVVISCVLFYYGGLLRGHNPLVFMGGFYLVLVAIATIVIAVGVAITSLIDSVVSIVFYLIFVTTICSIFFSVKKKCITSFPNS